METLTREEIRNVIEGRGAASRVPLLYDQWIGANIFGGDAEKEPAGCPGSPAMSNGLT